MPSIVVQHQIKDPEKFFSRTEEVIGNAPPGISPRSFFPSEDKSRATCLWEGDLDGVREYVDSASVGVAENTYYVLDEENAFGLPEPAAKHA